MMMTTDRERQRLLSAWRQLDAEDRRNVRLFAEFLVQRQTACDEVAHPPPSEPLPIAKPDGETAVKALKNLPNDRDRPDFAGTGFAGIDAEGNGECGCGGD